MQRLAHTVFVALTTLTFAAGGTIAEPPTALDGPWWLVTAGVPDERVISRPQPVVPQAAGLATLNAQFRQLTGVGTDAPAPRTWHVTDIERAGNFVHGRIALVGASFLSVGRFQLGLGGGGNVGGTITDDDGSELATVSGGVTPTGARGSFTARNGETGEWSWDAPSPQHFKPMLDALRQAAQSASD